MLTNLEPTPLHFMEKAQVMELIEKAKVEGKLWYSDGLKYGELHIKTKHFNFLIHFYNHMGYHNLWDVLNQ